MIKRRAFLGGAFCAAAASNRKAQSATASPQNMATPPSEPLVWPVVTKLTPDIRSFAGHTDTVPDIVGQDRKSVRLYVDGLQEGHIHDLALKARTQGRGRLDQTLLLRSLADRLRGSNGFGSFASDTVMKLGLLGTIIGGPAGAAIGTIIGLGWATRNPEP